MPDSALSVIFNDAERTPLAAGLNVTLIEQLLPAFREVPQFPLLVKSDAFVPVIAITIELSVVAPVFFKVTVLVLLLFTT